ncbi:hypothetical protein [Novosphingobium lindaniclasticum]|uniref:Helix-turn-helix domain-containing protein n=1 Tax=Novosphingobium lindaniclasticum LE124 TaxID=1096930 RepID=T0I5D3_9SPHN|nr:hypothetical protein [Novosphingobium lindaniclasticum]EQB19573.1 hypothetical protein L284_01290 [Novosphingobium lindaniclasticum LE124]
MRYDDDREAVWAHWLYYRSTAAELAKIYGFKARTIAGWITEWKGNPAYSPAMTAH